MKAQYFVYTRNRYDDYKPVYVPDDNFCSPETRKYFLKQSRGVINIETYSGSLDEPRWLISRKGNCILFGIGVMNRILGVDNNTDYTGTPIRGFFGVVINASDNQIKVPFDIKFFVDLYTNIIDPIWNYLREDFKFKGVEVTQDFNDYECVNATTCAVELNTIEKKTVILPISTSIIDVIGSILLQSDDCSFVSGLSDKEHACFDDYSFYNATVIGIDERIEKSKVKTELVQKTDFRHSKETKNEDIVKPIQQKKDFRPKLIMVIGILMVALIIILCKTCQGNQTSQDPSISGDTIQINIVIPQGPVKK